MHLPPYGVQHIHFSLYIPANISWNYQSPLFADQNMCMGCPQCACLSHEPVRRWELWHCKKKHFVILWNGHCIKPSPGPLYSDITKQIKFYARLQGEPKFVGRPLVFSSINLFTALIFFNYEIEPLSQTLVAKWNSPCHPRLNVALHNGCPCQYGVDQHWKWEAGKSLINTPESSNTFGSDCSYTRVEPHTLQWKLLQLSPKSGEILCHKHW